MGAMAQPLVSDELWELFEPLIPKVERRYRYPGRRRIDDRKVLTGILFVLKTGIPWERLPQELGCGSGMTCWRRLREWQEAGVWQRLHELLLAKLREAERIDWSRVVVDSAQVPAVLGAPKPAPAR
jgi:transposase